VIVISGALVLVALVLLVIGLVSTSLGFVYASIAVSVVSFVFLLIGILQRRGEQVPEPASAAAPAMPVSGGSAAAGSDVEGVTTIVPATSRATAAPVPEPVATEAAAPADTAPVDASVTGSVLVVPGRPRYHVSGCRYLTGKDPEEVAVATARADGYTACGVCKPDSVLAEEAAAQPHPQPDEPVPGDEAPGDVTAKLTPEPVAAAPDPVKAARRTTRASGTTSAGSTPAKAPAKKAAAKAPAKTAAKKAPAKAAAEPAGAKVVVIPDRGKFHLPECRFVRDASDTKELSRAAATRQGYVACGVCKP